MNTFTVDTHLFRELGELLVGRDSTALIELVKNAYDADATSVTVYGEAIDDLERGFIRITDDGIGMNEREFAEGFLRVASRTRNVRDRTSEVYSRRFTGTKGIGRLAAHKLAGVLEVETVPRSRNPGRSRQAVRASIDWGQVERAETLDKVLESAVRVDTQTVPASARSGTTITLHRLRRRWSRDELALFLWEVQDFEAPEALVRRLSKSLIPGPRLLKSFKLRDSSSKDPGFVVRLEGAFEGGEDYWVSLAEAANWLIEIDARRDEGKVRYRVSPAAQTLSESPSAEPADFSIDHPDPKDGPFFQCRILVHEGALPGPTAFRRWGRRTAGVRVFLEGFRVLPYGDRSNDWLSLDSDYARRERSLPRLDTVGVAERQSDRDAPLVFLPNRGYFGAVFLTEKNAPTLRTLVNREGFVPESPYYHLVELVRTGIDLSVRVRAAVHFEKRRKRREERQARRKRAPESRVALSQTLRVGLDRALSLLGDAKRLNTKGDIRGVGQVLSAAHAEIAALAEASEDFISEESMLRVLASVGTQMAAFIHEINALLGAAESIEAYSEELREHPSLAKKLRSELARLHSLVGDLRRGLERQAAYLVDVVTPDARRRRTRQSFAERFDAGVRLVEPTAQRRSIEVRNEIPRSLKSPPMFAAELTAIFSNLMTNAVKAAGQGGRIRASGGKRDGRTRVTIENTGARVDPKRGERWFKPFESTTATVDPVLGQGMGLGLPITRRILEEYGAEIKFAAPSEGFSTAVEVIFSE